MHPLGGNQEMSAFDISCCILLLLQSLTVLMKALAGDVPWPTYTRLLQHCHAVSKDHATAIDTAKYIQQLVTGVSYCSAAVVPALIGQRQQAHWQSAGLSDF
jgi:hypothetical protein